jgi:hypothetical protein
LAADSRLLRFESDSLASPPICVHGNPAHLLAQEGFAAHANRGVGRRVDAAARSAEYTGAGVAEAAKPLSADEIAARAATAAASSRDDPVYRAASGLQRSIGDFVHGRDREAGGAAAAPDAGVAGAQRHAEAAARATGGKVQHL